MAKRIDLYTAARLLNDRIGNVANWGEFNYRPTIRRTTAGDSALRARNEAVAQALDLLGLSWWDGDDMTDHNGRVQSVKACNRAADLLANPPHKAPITTSGEEL